LSDAGAHIEFLDTANTFEGWKVILNDDKAWVQYNQVDFGVKNLKTIKAQIYSTTGGKLWLRAGKNGTVIAEINVPQSGEWIDVSAPLTHTPTGVVDLFVSLDGKSAVEIDWISFTE
jgi:hypothetical protein